MTLARLLVLTASALAVATVYADKGSKKEASASGGATAQSGADKAAAFKSLDLDGDGMVSKAEAAGHAEVTLAFDRADRNRDGKLTLAEYERYGKAKAAKAAAKSRQATARKAERSASAGGTKAKGK